MDLLAANELENIENHPRVQAARDRVPGLFCRPTRVQANQAKDQTVADTVD